MDLYAPIAKNIIYPLWALKNRSKHLGYLKEYEETQWWSTEKIKSLQWERLKKMLEHAYLHCPFYKNRFDSLNLKPEDIREPQDLLSIPLLTKKDIQQNLDDLRAQNYALGDLVQNRTGGSTGTPLLFYHDKKRMDTRLAATLRHNRWADYDIGDKTAVLWGSRYDYSFFQGRKARLKNLLLNRALILDTSSITQRKMFDFADKIKKFKPKVFLGYANSMYLFACFLEANNIIGVNPKSIITSAEVLHPHEREKIEKIFNCKVFDRYGCREVSIVASECEKHSGLHINAENLYIEFINQEKTAKPGEVGDVVITDLLNFGMPFIRYKVEDMGIPGNKPCACGRGLPLMQMVAGRMTDFIITPDGKYISGAALTIYMIATIPGIKQAQLIQEEKSKVIFKIVKDHKFNQETVLQIEKKAIELLGNQIKVTLDFVDEIPKEASGKYRFCISKVRPDFVE
ncbi:MAG: phenylacetate--CoA ligase family protein [candidate division Zixibacteria bacterium]|nr:phenylacetate--CoA ligase family protein [candidate division Zixibacteria bacterium]